MLSELNEKISAYGTGFKITFIALAIIYLIEIIAYFLMYEISNTLPVLIISLVLLVVPILFYKSGRLDFVLGTFLFLPIIGVGGMVLYNFIQITTVISSSMMYVIMGVHALLLGLSCAFVFSKFKDKFKSYYLSSLFFSSLIAIIAVVWVVVRDILMRINEQLASLKANAGVEGGAAIIEMFNTTDMFNPIVAFILVFVLFNLPYLFYFKKYQDKNWKLLLLHLIPVVVFIILSVLSLAMSDSIIASV